MRATCLTRTNSITILRHWVPSPLESNLDRKTSGRSSTISETILRTMTPMMILRRTWSSLTILLSTWWNKRAKVKRWKQGLLTQNWTLLSALFLSMTSARKRTFPGCQGRKKTPPTSLWPTNQGPPWSREDRLGSATASAPILTYLSIMDSASKTTNMTHLIFKFSITIKIGRR